jgi:hypothetical protein
MASVASITIIKSFTYRGAAEEYSNKYYLSGDIPADAAAWRTLFDALVAQEKTLYLSTVTVVRGYGHDSDDPNADSVWTVDLTVSPNTPVAGTLSATGGLESPGDCAVWARWKTSRNNTRGKPIYLRKYYHPAFVSSSGPWDAVLASQVTALNAFGLKMMDGTFLDGRTIRSRTHAETLISHGSSTYVTTRTLKRRGRRP